MARIKSGFASGVASGVEGRGQAGRTGSPWRRFVAATGLAAVIVGGAGGVASAQTPNDPYGSGAVTTSTTKAAIVLTSASESATEAATQPSLPVTGGDVVGMALLGLGTASVGGGLVLAGRRKRNRELEA